MELHLASMENISCWAFRNLVKGPTDSYTGALSLNFILRKREWKEVDLFPIPQERQWIQIATSKEEECRKLKKLKKYLNASEIAALKEIIAIKRKSNSLWGV